MRKFAHPRDDIRRICSCGALHTCTRRGSYSARNSGGYITRRERERERGNPLRSLSPASALRVPRVSPVFTSSSCLSLFRETTKRHHFCCLRLPLSLVPSASTPPCFFVIVVVVLPAALVLSSPGVEIAGYATIIFPLIFCGAVMRRHIF